MIHQYKNNGFNIVLDVNSGAVHVADDVVYDVIASMVENHMEEEERIRMEEAQRCILDNLGITR